MTSQMRQTVVLDAQYSIIHYSTFSTDQADGNWAQQVATVQLTLQYPVLGSIIHIVQAGEVWYIV